MKTAQGAVQSMSGSVRKFAKETLTARNLMVGLAGAAGAGYAAKRIFDLGARVQETGSKFSKVFGESADAV